MTKRNLEKRQKMHDEFFTELREKLRQQQWERKIGDKITNRLFDLRVNYILRYGSDPFTMFKLYVDITRGIKL